MSFLPKQSVLKQGPSHIDFGNPITAGLSFFLHLDPYRLVPWFKRGKVPAGALLANSTFSPGSRGRGISSAGSLGTSGFVHQGTGITYALDQTRGSVFAYVEPNFAPGSATINYVGAFATQSSFFPAGPNIDILRHSDNKWYMGWYAGADHRVSVSDTGTFIKGRPFIVGFTYDTTATVKTRAYVGTREIGQRTAALTTGATANGGSLNFISAGTFFTSVGGSANSSWGGTVYWLAAWDRELTPAEVARLHVEPFSILQPSPYRHIFDLAAGGGGGGGGARRPQVIVVSS